MAARSKARKRALDVLFESEVRGLPLGATLDALVRTALARNADTISVEVSRGKWEITGAL